MANSSGRDLARPLGDDAPTTQVPIVRDDNPPTTKVPIIRDDDPPTTVLSAITEDPQPVVNSPVLTAAKSASQGKTLPGEKTSAATITAAENPPYVRVASQRRSRHTAAIIAPEGVSPLPGPSVPAPPVPVAPVSEEPVSSAPVPPTPTIEATLVDLPVDDVAEKVTPTVRPVIVPTLVGGPPAPAPKPPTPPQPAKPNGHRPLVVALVIVLALLLAGVGTLIGLSKYYEGKAKIGTQVAGVNVAGQTAADLAVTAQNVGGDFTIDADFQGTGHTFSMADLGVTLDAQSTAQQALAADSGRLGWLPFHSADVPLIYNYSADKIQQVLTAAFVADDKLPQNAAVTFDDGTGKYAAAPDTHGVNIDPTSVVAAIETLAHGGSAGTVTLNAVDATAPVQAAAADQAAAAANALVGQSYTFTAGGKSVTLAPDQLNQFITLTANPSAATIDVAVDQAAVVSGLPAILNAALARPPINQQDLYTPDGSKKIAVGTWGQDGTVVTDTDAAAAGQALVAAMNDGQPLTFAVSTTPQHYSVDKVTVGGAYDQPNGSKWIDVNQTTYQVTLYEGTTPVFQTVAVTGAPATPTHNGTFYVYLKYDIQTMRGHNADGSKYVTPDVPWVSYFNGSEALHGAYWRSSFGYRASHGCVNLPVPDAKTIYDWAPLGTMVVVHN